MPFNNFKKEKKLHHKWSHFQRERKVVEASESETTALFIWSSKVRNNHISVAILNQGLFSLSLHLVGWNKQKGFSGVSL